MGTNYYHRTKICDHCDRYDKHHIGKSSWGWTFSFHGERDVDPTFNVLGEIVASFEDWKIRLKKGKIFDEYGEKISLTDFIEMVEEKITQSKNHTTYCRENHLDHAEKCWLDKEGHSFAEGEFS